MEEILKIISKLKRPFAVASADSFAYIKNLKDFEPFVKTIVAELRKAKSGEKISALANELEELFSGYDSLPLNKKIKRIKSAQAIIDNSPNIPSDTKTTKIIRPTRERFPTETSIKYIKGVGEQRSKLLSKLNINSIYDALLHLPIRYEDRSALKKISALIPGQEETFVGSVLDAGLSGGSFRGRGGRRRIYQIAFKDETGVLVGKWFNFRKPYMDKKYLPGKEFLIHGTVKVNSYSRAIEIIHPEIEDYSKEDKAKLHVGGITPIYRLTEGLHQRTMRSIIREAVDKYTDSIDEYYTPQLLERLGLAGLKESFQNIHAPPNNVSLDKLSERNSPFHKRIIFDEFFFLELGLAIKKNGVKEEKRGKVYHLDGKLAKLFLKILPFKLTGAQQGVIGEIRNNLTSDNPMNRLLQGDVGCGKTVVAFYAMLIAVDNGFQTAIMAPTEILAEQHYRNFKEWGERLGINIAILTSSIKGKKRERILADIRKGRIDIIVGTHAIIQEKTDFHNIGLAVIDEQHRFGVMQRGTLKKKGLNCDILIMTATPIPRTLAMTVYGDLDVSVINEMPKGRKPIKTKLFFDKGLPRAYSTIVKEIEKGGQVYIVYPLVEESEKSDLKAAISMKEELERDIFPNVRIGLVHGKMKQAEKEEIMSSFYSGNIQILVATTVVEVGVDVPNASIMMIEHAERFGLSQLHQLRGRVGRGIKESYCLLVAHYPISNEGKKRLRVMTENQDGFYIAEKDLEIRGPGQFLGTRQSGLPEFKVASLVRDQHILSEARKEAFSIVAEDPHLSDKKNRPLREILRKGYSNRFELGEIG